MALFRKKDGDSNGGGDGNNSAEKFTAQPDKARTWFEHAKSHADRYSYDTAIYYYATGIALDPESMSAHEAIYDAAIQHGNRGGKPAAAKDVKKLEGSSIVSKMAAAQYAWMMDIRNAALGLKPVELAVKADVLEPGNWMAIRLFPLLRGFKKANKSTYLKAKEVFAAVSAWDQAIACGEMAMQLDPRDADLEAEIKNLAAQRAMDQGGYEKAAGQGEGGFRDMIKDADRQRQLIEDETISQSASVEERNLARAKAAYEQDPSNPDSINKFATALRRLETPESLETAQAVYLKGYETTGEYRFRLGAGDLRISALRKKERQLRDAAANDPDAAAQLAQVRQQRLELESVEYRERVEKYPTDRVMKFDLGSVEFELGNTSDAMACFQASKDEPRYKVRAGHMLGRCFASEGWHLDAIAEYREALTAIDATEKDRELDIRYDLMASLLEHAKIEQSLDDARNAREICSSIARKDITYRDIRDKRNEIEQVIKDLTG